MGIRVEIRCPSCKRTAVYNGEAPRQPRDGEWSVCRYCHCALRFADPGPNQSQQAPRGWIVPEPDEPIPAAVDRWRAQFRVLERLQSFVDRVKRKGGG
jgi:hypothetical protein